MTGYDSLWKVKTCYLKFAGSLRLANPYEKIVSFVTIVHPAIFHFIVSKVFFFLLHTFPE